MKVYAFFSEGKQQGSRLWKSERMAIEEMNKANQQFKEYNDYITKNNMLDKHKLISPVEVKQVNFSHKTNLDI